jgi:hypothetical protein
MFRVSLREMFVLVAAVSLAIVSLIFASLPWQAIIGLMAMLSAIVAIIVGLVDRGPRRAFAIGFAVAMLGYLLVFLNSQKFTLARTDANVELDAYQGRLPTSLLLQYFYAGSNRGGYFVVPTGERIPESESATLSPIPGNAWGQLQTSTGRPVYYEERPPRENFMAIGHFWWGLLFGYVGGHFARFVYLRRAREAKIGAPS